jgi:hypothetical protein
MLSSPGCQSAKTASTESWSPDQAILPSARFQGNLVEVHNIRNCSYRTADDYSVHYYDRTYDLDKLSSVDFIMAPLFEVQGGAHTFLSFGFGEDEFVAISVEVRRKKGEGYSAVKSLLPHYGLIYVVGDERDLIGLRANYWLQDVYVYRARASREQTRQLFVDMLERANRLIDHPEHYNLLTNNCTTNIMRHINHVSPHRVPYNYEILFPGYSDRLAYDLGLLATDKPFERAKDEARVNELAYIYRDAPDFSLKIRR